jgi:hypothetical protein
MSEFMTSLGALSQLVLRSVDKIIIWDCLASCTWQCVVRNTQWRIGFSGRLSNNASVCEIDLKSRKNFTPDMSHSITGAMSLDTIVRNDEIITVRRINHSKVLREWHYKSWNTWFEQYVILQSIKVMLRGYDYGRKRIQGESQERRR